MALKLASLNPEIKDGVLLFDCPNAGHQHRIRIPIREDKAFPSNGAWWVLEGELPNVTARNPHRNEDGTPGPASFNCHDCFHLSLVKGELV
jgi:hypothetical protein